MRSSPRNGSSPTSSLQLAGRPQRLDAPEFLYPRVARASASLQAEREQSQHTFDNMSEGFGVLDTQWRVVQMNAAGLAAGRRCAHQVIGHNHWAIWPETI